MKLETFSANDIFIVYLSLMMSGNGLSFPTPAGKYLVLFNIHKTYMLEELAHIVLQMKILENRRMRRGMKKFAKEK